MTSRTAVKSGDSGLEGQLGATTSISEYLALHESKSLLRFITCGSVDDGKSTLIGRLLHDSKLLLDDQLATLESDSRRFGTQNGEIDFALLVDGLAAEREQGITIDVAYRFFGTEQRKFIVADCPGHEQYTRNMATGASTADLAIVLVDARKGLLTQTRRHSYIVSLLGIRHVILAVNKMDLIDYDQATFERIAEDYQQLAERLGIENVHSVPLSALKGDNVMSASTQMPWYQGDSLLGLLETIDVSRAESKQPFRLPVQWVNRPNQNFRGFSGQVASGEVRVGDEVIVLPSGTRTRLASVINPQGESSSAREGEAVTVTLADEVDVSRGDVIAATSHPPEVADQFASHVLWMADTPLLPGRGYWMKIGSQTVAAQITEIKHRVDINSQKLLAAKRVNLNEVAYCNLMLDQPIAFEPYADNRTLGGFILIDRQSNATVGCGTIDFALRRATNIHWHQLEIGRQTRAAIKGQNPSCLWFTGLSGSGKSTIANLVDRRLHTMGYHTYILDGDNVRHGLNKDLGFTDEDRVENIRRVAEVAKLMVDAGLIVLVSFISPFRDERRMARELFDDGEFLEVFVDTPLELCEQRDPKGLYRRARAGEIPNFTGISSPYQPPEHADIHLQTADLTTEQSVELVTSRLLGQTDPS
ncbi:sulfate adenylyltransferase subunit CysN [Dokdonella sp.]|uniref:sulfate adenylyltransferase subunit CysN n=1 Tax=Dokdonella sp. TaxID=2291710 RepID=UPI0039C8ADDB